MERIKERVGFREIFLSKWHPYAWIVLAILLLYSKSLFFDFTHLDDKELIVDNYCFISNVSNVPQAFMTRVFPNDKVPYYRPMLTVSFILDSVLGGTKPFEYHFTNIILHSIACFLVFLLLLRLISNRLSAFLFTLFFTIHPVLVQAVAWIPGRNDSMLTIFILASFLSFLNYLNSRKSRHLVLYFIFFMLALFTKETAIAIIAVSLLYIKLIYKGKLRSKEERLFAAGCIITTAFWFTLRQMALLGSLDSSLEGLGRALLVSAPAVIQYVGKIIFPFNLSVFPIIKDTTFIYGILAITLITFALWRSKYKDKAIVFFGLSWFLLFLAPSLMRPRPELVHDFQEHRLYLPIIGILILFSQIDIFKKEDMKRSVIITCVGILAVLAAINIRHTENFRNKLTYWENAASTAPHSCITHFKVADMYYDEGMMDKAEVEYKKAISLDWRVASPVYSRLGHVYLAKGRLKDAELEFRRAIAACDANFPSYVSLGAIYYREGRQREAADMWVKALRVYPDSVDALRNLAIFCAEYKDYKAARFYIQRLKSLGVEPPPEFLKTVGEK